MNSSNEIDQYIHSFTKETQVMLEEMRETIKAAAPCAEEVISYKMPAYRQDGILVYFAGYKHHVGFYPTGRGIAAFESEIKVYKHAKGSVQFPLDQPLPVDLITRIVKFRLNENLEKKKLKAQKK